VSLPRDPWFDNAKLILVTLVVVGHGWTLLPDTGFLRWLYDYLYLWHMPAFLVVTGYLSQSFTWSERHLKRLATGVLLPYVVFEGALVLFRWSITGADYDHLWVEPHWPMWFLLALLLWRLATPVLRNLPHALPFAVGVSLLGGLHQFDYLELDRVFGFLPFFVLGLVARREHLEWLRRHVVRTLGLVVIAVATLAPAWVDGPLRTEWLYYRSGYEVLGVSPSEGMAIRLALLATSGLLALAFLAWMPRRRTWFTGLGAATLVVYLFHGFAVKAAEYAGFGAWAAAHPMLALAVATGAGVVLSLALAAPPVARRLRVVVEPTTVVRR
jgi:fucose 4-O-acetylase-like acetyltransferase